MKSNNDTQLLDPVDLLVQASAISGRGLFAARAFARGDAMMIIHGEPIDEAEAHRREHAEANWYIYWNHGHNFIDAAQTPKGRFLNHACLPNSITRPRDASSLYLVALRDIAAGEELTMDYDYREIYDVCRSNNPGCMQAACPRAAQVIQGESS